MKHLVLSVPLIGLLVAPALAQAPTPSPDCSALIRQVRDQVANRFDSGRHAAVDMAAQAEQLQADKKPADCLAKVQEAARAAGLTVP